MSGQVPGNRGPRGDETIDGAVGLPPERFRRVWNIVVVAGAGGALFNMTCMSGAPQVKFLSHVGATAFHFGLIAGLASLAVAMQLAAGLLVHRLPRRKPLWMASMILHRLAILVVLAAPSWFADASVRVWWIVGALFVSHLLSQSVIPIWLSWMSELAPRATLNRHWASRHRATQAASLVASLAIAFFFHHFERQGEIRLGYTILALSGIVLGLMDIFLFAFVPEPPREPETETRTWSIFLQPLRDPEFRPFLIFSAYWTFAVSAAAPFFVLYMQEELEFTVLTTQLILTGHLVGHVAASRFWGVLCDTFGYRPVIRIITVGKIAPPLVFLLAPTIPAVSIPMIALFMVFDGAMNAGLMLAFQGVRIKNTPRSNRAMYIAAAGFLSTGVVGGLAPVLSGALITALADLRVDLNVYTITGFHVAFLLSLLLRAGANLLTARLREPGSVSARVVIQRLTTGVPFRVVGLLGRLDPGAPEARRTAVIERLGEIGSPLAIRDLIRCLEDESRPVRHAAATALGRIGHSEATEPLARALLDPRSGIQTSAAHALGRIGDEGSLRALIEGLGARDFEALAETIDSLAAIGDSAAILPLICLFQDARDDRLRRTVAAALCRLTAADSIEEMLAIVGRPDLGSPGIQQQRRV